MWVTKCLDIVQTARQLTGGTRQIANGRRQIAKHSGNISFNLGNCLGFRTRNDAKKK
jgi:hypothetical protein